MNCRDSMNGRCLAEARLGLAAESWDLMPSPPRRLRFLMRLTRMRGRWTNNAAQRVIH